MTNSPICTMFHRTIFVQVSYPFFSRICVDGQRDTLVPTDIRTCLLPRKCKTSKWSEWKIDNDCKDRNVNLNDNQESANFINSGSPKMVARWIRTRHVERLPQASGKPCPHLKEYRTDDPKLTGIVDVKAIKNNNKTNHSCMTK